MIRHGCIRRAVGIYFLKNAVSYLDASAFPKTSADTLRGMPFRIVIVIDVEITILVNVVITSYTLLPLCIMDAIPDIGTSDIYTP